MVISFYDFIASVYKCIFYFIQIQLHSKIIGVRIDVADGSYVASTIFLDILNQPSKAGNKNH